MAILGLTGAPIHKGSWGTPDFGITEKLQQIYQNPRGNKYDYQGGSNLYGTPAVRPTPPLTNPDKPVTLGASTSIYGGTGSVDTSALYNSIYGSQAPSANTGGGGGSSGPSIMDIINQAYDSEQGYFNQVEGTAKSQAQGAQDQINKENTQARGAIQENQTNQLGELTNRENTANQNYRQGVVQSKQLLQDLQARQASQLAAVGGYGGSVSDALTEQLGRQSSQSIGVLNTQKQQSLDAIGAERQKVNSFYTQKLADLQNSYERNIADITNQLQNTLNQIAGLRTQSSQAKAQATMEAWQNYADQRAQANLEARNFAQQLAMWQAQKDGYLSEASQRMLAQTPGVDQTAGLFDPTQSATVNQNPNFGVQAPNAPIQVSRATQTDDDQMKQLQALGILPSSVSQGFNSLTA